MLQKGDAGYGSNAVGGACEAVSGGTSRFVFEHEIYEKTVGSQVVLEAVQ